MTLKNPEHNSLLHDTPADLADVVRTASATAKQMFERPDLDRDHFPQLTSHTEIEQWAAASVKIARKSAYLNGKLSGSPKQSQPFLIDDSIQKKFEKQVHAVAALVDAVPGESLTS